MLTDLQKKMVEDNHNLIFYVLNRNNWSMDDYYGAAAVGLCKAAEQFDETKGFSFATYACTAIRNEILMELRSMAIKEKYNIPIISLDTPLPDLDDTLTIGDMVSGNAFQPEDYFQCTYINECIDNLKPKQRSVIRLTMDGYNQEYISKYLGFSQSYIARILAAARKKLLAQTA